MIITQAYKHVDTERAKDLRRRVREAMEQPPARWDCPTRIDDCHMSEPIPVRKARAIALQRGWIGPEECATPGELDARMEHLFEQP